MGNYAECWIGSLYLGRTKNEIDTGLMRLFRSRDKTVVNGKKRDLAFQNRGWINDLEDDEEVTAVYYRAPVTTIRDRLELKGYTLQLAKSAFSTSMRAQAVHYSEWQRSSGDKIFGPVAQMSQAADVDLWLAALKTIRAKEIGVPSTRTASTGDEGTLMGYMLEREWHGYPGPDPNVPLRLALEVCLNQDEVIYDVTDLVLAEYFRPDEDLVSFAQEVSAGDLTSSGKTIILTEGRSDSRIISDSIEFLYPHLSDYFTFMDFEGARVGGGAGSLANIVKAFAGAGIVNKTIAIFDNDTAAEVAIRSLRGIRIPANIKILKLPDLAALSEYPTIGPSGLVVMNVNGIAASIELYLGKDALSDENGKLEPVQWTGYEASLGKYQGEVLTKARIQERYRRRLEACSAHLEQVETIDFSGVRAILSAVFAAFHEFDGELIISFTDEYYAN